MKKKIKKSPFSLILQNKFTTKSDVWSFAITLWEILSFAREQPFEHLSDDKVIENFGHIYRDDKKHVSKTIRHFYHFNNIHSSRLPDIFEIFCEAKNDLLSKFVFKPMELLI